MGYYLKGCLSTHILVYIMKLLILSTICISSIASFRISESEAKTVLSRERRWGRSNEEKVNDKIIKRCGRTTCDFEEWAETAENYKSDGFDEDDVRTPEKRELFDQMYTNCVGGVTGRSQQVVEKRTACVKNVRKLYHQWPTPAPTDPVTQAVQTEGTTPTTVPPTTTTEPTTVKVTTTEQVTTEQVTTTTTQATTQEVTTTTTPQPTTSEATTEKQTTTLITRKTLTPEWATTANRRNRYRNR